MSFDNTAKSAVKKDPNFKVVIKNMTCKFITLTSPFFFFTCLFLIPVHVPLGRKMLAFIDTSVRPKLKLPAKLRSKLAEASVKPAEPP